MDFFVEGEIVLARFKATLSCRRRLFFGTIFLTNYRLITFSSTIQRNTGYKSNMSKKPLQKLSHNRITKHDSFLAKLGKQILAESIANLKKVHQFPIRNVVKKKVKKNMYIYETILEYEDNGIIKKEAITIRIQPNRHSGSPYKDYKKYYASIFNILEKTLKME